MHAGAGTGAGAVHHAIHATCPELACLGALCWQHLFFHRGCQPAHVCPLVFMRLHACRLVLLEDASFNLVEMASNALQLLILAEPDAYIALAKQLVQQVNCYVQMCLPELMIKHASPMPLWMAASIWWSKRKSSLLCAFLISVLLHCKSSSLTFLLTTWKMMLPSNHPLSKLLSSSVNSMCHWVPPIMLWLPCVAGVCNLVVSKAALVLLSYDVMISLQPRPLVFFLKRPYLITQPLPS